MRIIYQAGPLFSEAEQNFHRMLSALLRDAGHTVIWPGDLFAEAQIEASGPHAPSLIFNSCRDAIDRCDCMVAVLAGAWIETKIWRLHAS